MKMGNQGLTDIDSLALAMRERESRRLIAEAITAYRGGALRSAIISTWIAVAFDIVTKARELSAQGEAAPKVFVQELESAIANRDERARFMGRSRLLAITLREIAKAKTAIYDSIVPGYIAQKFDTVGDDVLLTICPFLENDTRIWEWLSEPVRLRIKRLLQTENVETLKTHAAFDGFVVPALSEVLLARFDGFDRNTQISIISEHRKRELVSPGIKIFSQAGSYRTAEAWGQSIILSLILVLAANDISVLLAAVQENEHIWYASGTPAILETVFDSTRRLLPETRLYWQAFVDRRIAHNGGDTDHYYSYPGLQQRLAV